MNKIFEIRHKLKMTRKQFADALCITVGAVSNYENSSRMPRLTIAYRMLALSERNGHVARLEDIYASDSQENKDISDG